MASTQLNKTLGTPTSNYKWTISCWVKRGNLGDQTIISNRVDGSNNSRLCFNSSNQLELYDYQSTNKMALTTSSVYRDMGAWYNIVVSSDNSIGSPVTKIYVNGTETTNGTSTQYSQNQANLWNSAIAHYIGQNGASASYFDGSMTHFHFIDGTAYTPTSFGEVDSTSGIWKAKSSASVTYGTNGFFLKMENSGAMGTDSSGKGNNFTVSGTLTQNVDTPDNNFATMNPLDNYYANSTFSNGNTTIVTNSGNTTYNTSTLGIPPTTKCYWEVKFNTVQSANGEVGIVNTPTTGSSAGAYRLYYQTYGISVNDGGAIWSANADTGITLGTLSTSDIVCFAWDGVNQALYVRKNGDAWINSGNPTSGASKTGAVKSFSGTSLTMFPAVGDQSGAHAVGTSTNFGNGFFGTTAVASSNADGNGVGKMEYAVPTGYYTLNTKNLKEFG